MDINAINDALNALKDDVTISVASLAGTQSYTIEEGTTVREFKAANGLRSSKLVTAEGVILKDSDVLTSDMSVFVSASKKNG